MTDMPDLAAPARDVAALVDGVSGDQLDAPTPCEQYTVQDLLNHLLELSAAFGEAARKNLGPATSTPPGATGPRPLPADWRALLHRQLDDLAAAWRDEGAWEGETQAGGVTLPGAVAGRVALNELVLHGWDLARATGQPYVAETATLRTSIGFLAQSTEPAARAGIFGPVVDVPADAPLLDQAVALAGRSPDWAPHAGRTPRPA